MVFRLTLDFLLVALLSCLSLVHAECTNPSVRKEWRSLTTEEKANWISAVNCMANTPSTGKYQQVVYPDDIVAYNTSGSYYDDFVYTHMDSNHIIHFTGLFFPFHRWYVQVYEDALRETCGFTGVSPYWDWASDAPDVYGSTLFSDYDSESGLGGWGNLSQDSTVQNGGFSEFMLSYPSPHIVRRNFTLQPYLDETDTELYPDPTIYANETFSQDKVDYMVNNFVGDFKGMQAYMEGFQGPHGSVHFILGGDLGGTCPNDETDCGGGPTFSANEPIFWLHHAMVDKVWYDWQQADPANAAAFYGGSVQQIDTDAAYEEWPTGGPPMLDVNSTIYGSGMFDDATIQDVISTTSGMLCYIYE